MIKLIKSQFSPTHASTKRKITDELNHNAGWYEVREGSPVEGECLLVLFVVVLIGKFTSSLTAHGSAFTLRYEHPKIHFPIHVDISPAVNTHLSFEQLGLKWPSTELEREAWRKGKWRTEALWPSAELRRAVKDKRVIMVAKQNFYWMMSFVECEKELSKHADEDGGVRKQVHKLLKMFHKRFWKTEKSQLNSYMIKVRSTSVKTGFHYPVNGPSRRVTGFYYPSTPGLSYYLSHCHSMGQIISLCVSVYVRACGHAYGRIFQPIFTKFGKNLCGPNRKN